MTRPIGNRPPDTDGLPQIPGRTGWPWTKGGQTVAARRPDGSEWPRVTVVMPSLNQAAYLEESIRSVILQGYPNLEFFVHDGGSVDGSVDIIRRYEPWISNWVTGPDGGQSNAIQRGFAAATGEVVAWLNSDDVYEPGALALAAEAAVSHPEAALVYGRCEFVDEAGRSEGLYGMPCDAAQLSLDTGGIPQPSAFIRRSALEAVGGLDTSLRYVMDYDLWIRLSGPGRWHFMPAVLSRFRHHATSKTVSETYRVADEYERILLERQAIRDRLSPEVRHESVRRVRVRMAQRALADRDEAAFVDQLSRAIGHGEWPFGSANRLAAQLLESRSPGDGDGDLSDPLVGWVARCRPRRRARVLANRIAGLVFAQDAFDRYRRSELREVPRLVGAAVRRNPALALNRGLLSIAVQSSLPLRSGRRRWRAWQERARRTSAR